MNKTVLKKLLKKCVDNAKESLKTMSGEKKVNDVRYRYFEYYSRTIAGYLVLLELIETNGVTKEHLTAAGLKVSENVLISINDQMGLANHSSFFISSIVYFETGIRRLASSINKENNNILATVKQLVITAKLDSIYLTLIEIIFYLRNAAMHNGGIHRRSTTHKVFKGKKFKFVKGEGISVTEEEMDFIFSEMMDFFKLVSFSEPIKGLSFIKDPFVEVYDNRK